VEITNLITKLFGPAEEINSRERGLTHINRWTILATNRFSVYLEHSFGDDWSCEYYPDSFISIGLADSEEWNGALSSVDRNAWIVSVGKIAA